MYFLLHCLYLITVVAHYFCRLKAASEPKQHIIYQTLILIIRIKLNVRIDDQPGSIMRTLTKPTLSQHQVHSLHTRTICMGDFHSNKSNTSTQHLYTSMTLYKTWCCQLRRRVQQIFSAVLALHLYQSMFALS